MKKIIYLGMENKPHDRSQGQGQEARRITGGMSG